jgi:DNA (cytosine-5)-methyltransferase 1
VKPLLLDTFCGGGGCTRGYQDAGWYVVGVDLEPQPNYCGDEFVQADALDVLANLYGNSARYGLAAGMFDAIHASPPCQAYTTMNNRHGSSSPPLIAETRQLLKDIGLPYVIENVSGALSEMRSPVELTGEMFGLRVHRPRLFESNAMLLAPWRPPRQENPVAVYGKNDQRRLWTRADGSELRCASLEEASEAMGIDWMTWDELREAIPPAYTFHIGTQLFLAALPSEGEE